MLRYHIVYFGAFTFLLASLFVLRLLCLDLGLGPLPSAAAPAIFALMMPFMQTVGGYFYDFPELFFMSSAVPLSSRGRMLPLVPLTALATANKESFLFFIITLYPLIRQRLDPSRALRWTGALLFVAGSCYIAMRAPYSENPGSTMHNHLLDGLAFYLNPLNLFQREITYGLKTFRGYSFIMLAAIAAVVSRGWPQLPMQIRHHVLLAALINFPLFLALCYPGEMRNLSMLFVGCIVLIARCLSPPEALRKQTVSPLPSPGSTGLPMRASSEATAAAGKAEIISSRMEGPA